MNVKNLVIAALVGVIAVGSVAFVFAQSTRTADIEVRVWESTSDPMRNYISARPAGGSWSTLGTIPLGRGEASAYETTSNGRFRYSDITLTVPLPRNEPRFEVRFTSDENGYTSASIAAQFDFSNKVLIFRGSTLLSALVETPLLSGGRAVTFAYYYSDGALSSGEFEEMWVPGGYQQFARVEGGRVIGSVYLANEIQRVRIVVRDDRGDELVWPCVVYASGYGIAEDGEAAGHNSTWHCRR